MIICYNLVGDFMKYEYSPVGVCTKKMEFEIENNIIKNVNIIGGCPGYSSGMMAMLKGMDVNEVIEKLENIKCGFKSTSCPAQIAEGLKKIEK